MYHLHCDEFSHELKPRDIIAPIQLHNWRAGASQPSRTTGTIFLYIIYIYIGTVHTVHVRMRGNYVKRLRDIKIICPLLNELYRGSRRGRGDSREREVRLP